MAKVSKIMDQFHVLNWKASNNISETSDAYAVDAQRPKGGKIDLLNPKNCLPKVHTRFGSTFKSGFKQ